MPLFDSLTKGVKDFFLEEEPGAAAAAPAAARPPVVSAPPLANLATGMTQPEQRHLDHIAQVMSGDGHDFGAFTRPPSTPSRPSRAKTYPACWPRPIR